MTQKPEIDFYTIHDQYYCPIHRFVGAVVKDPWATDDLTQETFFRAHRHIESLKDPSQISPWLFRIAHIAHNACLDHFRNSQKSRRTDHLIEESTGFEGSFALERKLQHHQMSACVQDRILLLPEDQRKVLWLYEVDGFKQKKIAEILDISVSNVKIRLHRARKKFKSILEENCTFEKDDRNVLVCEPK